MTPGLCLIRVVLVALAAIALAAPLGAQEIPRNQYLFHLPLGEPKLIPQTAASRDLKLFGDPGALGYRDVDPRDGIDDARNRVLLALALRFAPYMVQNTDNLPVNFQTFIENRDTFALWIDTWDIGGEAQTLVDTRGVNFSVLGRPGGDPAPQGRAFDRHPMPTTDPAVEDAKLVELMDRFTPGTGANRPLDQSLVATRPERLQVMFFNFPGEGEGTWNGVTQREYQRTPSERRSAYPHVFVHPFITGTDSTGYEVILQFWFFYPSNDSGMNHEGDWEHINVVLSPRSQVDTTLTAEVVGRILDGSLPATDDADDPLVLKRIDFYIHHLIMPFDFSNPNVYRPRADWEADVKQRTELRFREREIWDAIRYVAYADDQETILNTHPLVYIGADNKGLNQALAMPGPRNRDPHASYPFPGRYPNVGPGGTTDEVSHAVDLREYLRGLRDGTAERGPVFTGGKVLDLADPNRLRILPDWERVVEVARADAAGRRDFAWMLLPIRWGYPATRSPFSGILENFNTGNGAPIGPTYNAAWNVSGAAPGYGLYEPHAVPDLLPLQIQDGFRNDLGFLNLTVPLLLNLPPLDFTSRLLLYPVRLVLGSPRTVYYPARTLPFRFVGISSGVSVQTFNDNFASMVVNPDQYNQFVGGLLFHLIVNGADSTTQTTSVIETRSKSIAPFVEVSFYLGPEFVSENLVRNVRSDVRLRAEFSNIPPYQYDATINLWEYAGSIRYSPWAMGVQPYLKAGYGWSWYRLENARQNGMPLAPTTIDWIGPRNIWPNAWHLGLGAECVLRKGTGSGLSGLDLALRAEAVRYYQDLDLDLARIPLQNLQFAFPTLGDVPTPGVHRNDFILGLTLSF